jgi:hypothetical protein
VQTVLDSWTETEWITPVGLGELGQENLPAVELDTAVGPGTSGGLPPDYAQAIVRANAEIELYNALLADPADWTGPAESTGQAESTDPTDPDASDMLSIAQAAATVWQDDLDTAATRMSDLRTTVGSLLDSVSIVVNPMNTLSSNTGVFPVNIANNLDRAVDVRIEFDPANPDRMSIEPVAAQRVEAGEQQTVQVRAEAVANGQVPVDVQLATVDGTPLGSSQRTVINATQYGTIGWFVVGGSVLLFAGGLSWRMARGRRRNDADDAGADAAVELVGGEDMVTR